MDIIGDIAEATGPDWTYKRRARLFYVCRAVFNVALLGLVTLMVADVVGAITIYAASQRYELVAAIPKGSIVFDRATGETFQTAPLPMFRGQPE